MDNIEFFNRFTLSLMEYLYSSFPVPVEVNTTALAGGILPDDIDQQTAFDLVVSADHAVTFLTEEGFITHKGSFLEGSTFLQVRLSAKGLAVLDAMPDSLEAHEPLISRIRKALAGGAKEAAAETVRQLAQQAFLAAPAIVAKLTQ